MRSAERGRPVILRQLRTSLVSNAPPQGQQPTGGQEYYQGGQPGACTPQGFQPPAQPGYCPQPGYVQTAVMTAPRKSGVRTVFIVLLVVAILAGGYLAYRYFFGQQPRDTVAKFFDSVNEMDINAMVGCFDPTYEKAFKAVTGLLSDYIGIDLQDVIDIVPALYDFGLFSSGGYELQHADYRILSEEIQNNRATVTCDMTLRYSDGSTSSTTGVLILEKFGSDWRIVEVY
jgi:hypothetical protein